MNPQTHLHVAHLPAGTLLLRTYADGTLTAELLSADGRGTGEHDLVPESLRVSA